MTQIKTKIPAELEPAAVGGMVTDSKYVKDRVKNKTQEEVNADTEERVSTLEESVGTGGSVDERIAVEKNRAEQAEGVLDGKIATEKQRAEGVEGGLNTRLQTVEALAEISVGGGDIGIGTAADFESDDPDDQAKVPTVAAMLGGANDGVYDISARHNGATYADLAAALGYNGANVPAGVRRGGMSVKFVQSSDNNYVQYFCNAQSFTTKTSAWGKMNLEKEVNKILDEVNQTLDIEEEVIISPNIFDKDSVTGGYYLNPKLEQPVEHTNYIYSQMIDVIPGKIIIFNDKILRFYFHMYDASGNFIAATNDNNTLDKLTPANTSDSDWSYFTVPTGVYKMRFSFSEDYLQSAVFIMISNLSEKENYDISTYYPFGEKIEYKSKELEKILLLLSPLFNKKVIVIGDSMVYGNNVGTSNAWSAKIAEKVGLDYVVSSSGTTSKTENVMVNAGVNGVMLSNNNAPFASNISDAVINRYSEMDSDADYVVVFAGTNDAWALYRNEIQLGAIDSIDDTTFNGALNVLMQGLLTKYPSGKIAFITPYPAPSSDAVAISREAIINAIKAACIRNGGIPCFDNSIIGGIDWNNTAQKTALTQDDNTHLNVAGHTWVYTKYKSFIESL